MDAYERIARTVLAILRDFCQRTPGSLIEEKTAGFAWHYRAADPEYGAAQATELSLYLSSLLSNAPVEVLPGDMVLEVRPELQAPCFGRRLAEKRMRLPD